MHRRLYNNPHEWAFELIKFICRYKLQHPDNIECWFEYEAQLIKGYKGMSNDELAELCDDITSKMFDYLLEQQRKEQEKYGDTNF